MRERRNDVYKNAYRNAQEVFGEKQLKENLLIDLLEHLFKI